MELLPHELCLMIGSYVNNRRLFKIYDPYQWHYYVYAKNEDEAIMLLIDKELNYKSPLFNFCAKFIDIIIKDNLEEQMKIRKACLESTLTIRPGTRGGLIGYLYETIKKNKDAFLICFKSEFQINTNIVSSIVLKEN